jgi:hypothetical protein
MHKTSQKLAALCGATLLAAASSHAAELPKPDGKPADMSKPVKVFIIMGQSNTLEMGNVSAIDKATNLEKDGSLQRAVKEENLYPFLVDAEGKWTIRQDVRNVSVMQKRDSANVYRNDWLTISGNKIGIEIGIGHQLGNAIDEPVMLLKSSIGNRGLGWDLLPPGSERYLTEVTDKAGNKTTKVVAGYKDKPDFWDADPAKGTATEPPPWLDKNGNPINWYAGKQYDDDVANAKKILAELATYYPEATKFEVAGFFWWQGERDAGNPAHSSRYEKNLVQLINQLRKEFDAPNAKFVMATIGEVTKGSTGPSGEILNAMLAVDGESGKYPDFKGSVSTVYSHPLAHGGSGNSHYSGNAKAYMDVGLAMGEAMTKLLAK